MNKLTLIFIGGAVVIFGAYFLINRDSGLPVMPVESEPINIPPDVKPAPSVPKETSKISSKATPPAGTTTPPTNSPVVIPTPPASTSAPAPTGMACNTSLINANGFDSSYVVSKEACDLLNTLYLAGKAAGNAGDTYENRDGLHVNFCDGWSPSPDCPLANRLFPQHAWLLSGGAGRATSTRSGVTVGQASYAGETSGGVKHSIAYAFYKTQTGANILYDQYTKNNLYIYPSLEEAKKDNIANTPYVISSEYLAKDGGSYYVNAASGSDLPFVRIVMLTLAAFKPEVKTTLKNSSLLMPTLQMLIRHSHRSVSSESDYLTSVAHDNTYRANYLAGGVPRPSYDPLKLVKIANELTVADVPPVIRIKVLSENFTADEKLFNTPGAVARSVATGSLPRTITISAEDSVDLTGSKLNHVYEWRVLKGDSSRVKITPDGNKATIEFAGGSVGERLEVGVFVKKLAGKYYSVPGIISVYTHD